MSTADRRRIRVRRELKRGERQRAAAVPQRREQLIGSDFDALAQQEPIPTERRVGSVSKPLMRTRKFWIVSTGGGISFQS